jgi:hypothetical protein
VEFNPLNLSHLVNLADNVSISVLRKLFSLKTKSLLFEGPVVSNAWNVLKNVALMNERQFAINAIRKIVRTELDHFPLAQPQDLAKLLYQAVYGPRHAISNACALLHWLQDEMKVVQAYHHKLLLQELTIFQPMFRLYLKPAKENGFSTDLIHELFLFSCQTVLAPLASSWEELMITALHQAGFAPETYPDLMSCKEPFHHSKHYRDTYRPHYRLITMDAIQRFPEAKSILKLE